MAKSRLSVVKLASKVAAVLLCGLLACGLCPGFASAAQLEEGQLAARADLSPQAATKTVYVIASTTEKSDFFGNKNEATTKFTYNEDGLLTKRAYVSKTNKANRITDTYTYSGTALKKAKQTTSSSQYEVIYTTNKKGQFTKAVQKWSSSNSSDETRTFIAKYKSGKLKKLTRTNVYTPEGATEPMSTVDVYSYAYKNGRVASRTTNGYKATYSYDKMGNIDDSANTYNAKKRLAKQTQTTPGTTWEITYKYKALKVDASVADKVQAQQWAIINSNYNLAFGIAGI